MIQVGLCKNCQHVKKIATKKNSTFYLCMLSEKNPNFKKYPPLPVLKCEGYSKQ